MSLSWENCFHALPSLTIWYSSTHNSDLWSRFVQAFYIPSINCRIKFDKMFIQFLWGNNKLFTPAGIPSHLTVPIKVTNVGHTRITNTTKRCQAIYTYHKFCPRTHLPIKHTNCLTSTRQNKVCRELLCMPTWKLTTQEQAAQYVAKHMIRVLKKKSQLFCSKFAECGEQSQFVTSNDKHIYRVQGTVFTDVNRGVSEAASCDGLI